MKSNTLFAAAILLGSTLSLGSCTSKTAQEGSDSTMGMPDGQNGTGSMDVDTAANAGDPSMGTTTSMGSGSTTDMGTPGTTSMSSPGSTAGNNTAGTTAGTMGTTAGSTAGTMGTTTSGTMNTTAGGNTPSGTTTNY